MKLSHITIHTKKAEETIEFYKKYVGLEVTRAFGNITFMGDGLEGTLLEIISDEDKQFTGEGISIGFSCQDLDKQREIFINDGFHPTEFICPNPNVRFFYVDDPSGMKVQFI